MNHSLRLATLSLATLTSLLYSVDAAAQCGTNGQARCSKRPHPGLNVDGFANAVANNLATRNIKGYSLALYSEDGHPEPVLDMSAGFAIDERSKRNFDGNAVSAIGSVSKLLTEAAVRRAMEIATDAPAYSANRVDANTRFLDLLPTVFRRVAGTNSYYNDVTIEQILRHRGGVPNSLRPDPYGNPYDYWMMMARLPPTLPDGGGLPDGGPLPHDCVKTPADSTAPNCYSNDNYVIASMLLPIIRMPNMRNLVNQIGATVCSGKPAGRERDSCEIQYAFTTLGETTNAIVKEMLVDALAPTSASCDPTTLVNTMTVAFQYPTGSTLGGGLPPGSPAPFIRGCGVGGWFMRSHDVARIMRRVWDGSFFNHGMTGERMPRGHNGVLTFYRGLAVNRIEGMDLTWVLLSNSPLALTALPDGGVVADPNEFGLVGGAIDAAYTANTIAPPAPPPNPPVLGRVRAIWRCVQDGVSSNVLSLRISNRYDIKGSNLLDFNGESSEEIWSTSAENTTNASGTYRFYRGGTSPRATSGVFVGSWTLTRNSGNSISITRHDNASGWSGAYSCAIDPNEV
jgi:hypothetical protein